MKTLLIVASSLLLGSCATGIPAYEQAGPKNLKVTLDALKKAFSSDSMTVYIAEKVTPCQVHVLGQSKVSRDSPAELALPGGKDFVIGIMTASSGLTMGSEYRSDSTEVSVKPDANYELVYSIEDKASGYELFETRKGKRVSLPLIGDTCGGGLQRI